MMTPNIISCFLEELIQSYQNEKIFKFVHLPVQSGDDLVLHSMRRFYTITEFKVVVAAFRASFPEITLSTDVICGFPGENEKAFNATMKLIAEVKPEIVNLSKFFPRPRTSAAKMTSVFVPASEIKRRSCVVAELVKKVAFERNQHWVGWKGKVLVDEVGKVRGSWVGRNFAYKPIALKSRGSLLGRTLQVELVKAHSTYLKGKVIE
jgi:tRNA A37 methylthiotransferase MiaB